MTVKERIRLLVDELDDKQADAALVLLARLLATADGEPVERDDVTTSPASPAGHVLTSASPLWRIVGLIDDDGPTDVSENVDRYLAEAYADLHVGAK